MNTQFRLATYDIPQELEEENLSLFRLYQDAFEKDEAITLSDVIMANCSEDYLLFYKKLEQFYENVQTEESEYVR